MRFSKFSQVTDSNAGSGSEPIPEGMTEKAFEGTVEEYQGKKLDTPIKFSGKALVYKDVNAAKQSEDWPSDGETLKIINAGRVASAKAQAYQQNTKTLKEAYEKSPEFARKSLIASIMLTGKDQATAEALAAQILG